MAVAQTEFGTLTILGAPRHNHIGTVRTVFGEQSKQQIDPYPWQVSL